MEYNLTEGNITGNLLKFAFPLMIMIENLLQQCYNIADTLIVGRFLGADALAAVGSAYTLIVFLTSIILGLCMGSSAFFSMQFGAGNTERLKKSFFLAFSAVLNIVLDLVFVLVFHWGVKGAAGATVFSQYVSGSEFCSFCMDITER